MKITIEIQEEKTQDGGTRLVTTYDPKEMPSLCLALISGDVLSDVAINAATLIVAKEPERMNQIMLEANKIREELA